jgi:hypothetical protein
VPAESRRWKAKAQMLPNKSSKNLNDTTSDCTPVRFIRYCVIPAASHSSAIVVTSGGVHTP